ncbi:MAG: transaldolase [Deltaproteobacteria bacterium]|nr:transaldolase [Deltaproteobacteria bacterium]
MSSADGNGHEPSARVKLFADAGGLDALRAVKDHPRIEGFTTNPTLIRGAGVTTYEAFGRAVLEMIPDRPVSVGVVSDDLAEMERQARRISSWGSNVYVKIPVTNTRGERCDAVVERLSADGVRLNVTAVMTVEQVRWILDSLAPSVPCFVSIFAGRIADTGRDPVPLVRDAANLVNGRAEVALIWASPREILNVSQAEAAGCHVITLTPDLIAKLALAGKDLERFSLETVQMFHRDALAAGFEI